MPESSVFTLDTIDDILESATIYINDKKKETTQYWAISNWKAL